MKEANRIEEQKAHLNQIVLSQHPQESVLEHWAFVSMLIPEIKELQGFVQNNRYHIYDVLTHTFVVMNHVESDLVLRLSALFHDFGKPRTYTEDASGVGHFYGHEKVSAEMARTILRRLDYEPSLIEDVVELVIYHDYPLYAKEKPLLKLYNKLQIHLIDKLFALKKADCMAQNPAFSSRIEDIEDAYAMMKKFS